jgi:hypothetical protein
MAFGSIFAGRIFPLARFEPVPMEFEEQSIAQDGLQLPTPVKLRLSIERHLGNDGAADAADAAGELRSAFAELRRSLA